MLKKWLQGIAGTSLFPDVLCACFWPCPSSQLFQANQSVFGSSQGSSTEDLFADSIDSCDLDITEKVQRPIFNFSAIAPSLRCMFAFGFFFPPREWQRGSVAFQVSYLEKKVTELESDSLANSDLKSKLKQENTHLVHRQENTLHFKLNHYSGLMHLTVCLDGWMDGWINLYKGKKKNVFVVPQSAWTGGTGEGCRDEGRSGSGGRGKKASRGLPQDREGPKPGDRLAL